MGLGGVLSAPRRIIPLGGGTAVEVAPRQRGPQPPDPPFEGRRVYFMLSRRSGLLKIGFSVQPETRLVQLEQQALGRLDLELLASIPGDVDQERELHARFRDLRPLWGDLPEVEQFVSAEWFRYEGELREYVEGLAA